MSALVCIALLLFLGPFAWAGQASGDAWIGTLHGRGGSPIANATVRLQDFTAPTDDTGHFTFAAVPNGAYQLSVKLKDGQVLKYSGLLTFPLHDIAGIGIAEDGRLKLETGSNGSGGETLSANEVAAIPLNKRDFSQLLLLAAGTMTDANGTTNFTQQFAINGQRGVEAVFAMDGADISDPEMGGATFSNFNVDAVQEIQSSSGWLPAEVGHGAAGYTNILSRAGTSSFHGSLFEFLRNSALDARNFFDRRSIASPGRIPPFRRNEFGFTLGGPLYPGNKTQFFLEYQGFRQVLGTTQVLPVPTANERLGLDTTAFRGDTLFVPVDPEISSILNRYPLPNDPQGPFGPRTYATSSKVTTDADQLSLRIDHRLSSEDRLFARVTINNLTGPTTNPDQTAINPAFGILYVDHQRNAVLTWIRTPSATFSSDSTLGFTRTTPGFPTSDHTDPAVTFGDSLFEPFNSAAGSVTASFGNLFQAHQTFTWTRGSHSIKAGAEFRANRDTTYFGQAPNGSYTFGGGVAYSPVSIRSLSGDHNIAAGDALPDTLSALLTGSAFGYNIAVAPPGFPQGSQIGVAAISRYNVNFFLQDTWKISNRWALDYGLRYELYTPISERAKRTAGTMFTPGPDGLGQEYLINPQPRYKLLSNDWGPRLRVNWQPADGWWIRLGGALVTIPPNIWQDNMLTGSAPYVDYPRLTAAPGIPLLYGTRITPQELPGVYTLAGLNILASGSTQAVPANTVWDITRFEQGIAALSSSKAISPLNVNVISRDFRNSYMGTWSASLEHTLAGLNADVAYIGTAGISLPAINFPNAFIGATPQFAPYTLFNSSGQAIGGFGTEFLMTNRSHSTYHGLQASLQGAVKGGGPQIQASFTWSKSLDDDSTVIGGFATGSSGATLPAWPQNPLDTRAEKGPSSFDIERAFTLTAIQDLHVDRLAALKPFSSKLTRGWQFLSVSTLTSGAPFTVYSGVQQTGAGSFGTDRPDQVAIPDLSTSRTVREDYFGAGSDNATFFAIPIGVPGGTGPNDGVFGSLGRNTFRGPALSNFDFALIKDTPFEAGQKPVDVQLRGEFFNLFNIVNFGLPINTIKASGFGEISSTASNSRQIQFSLKVMF